MAESAVDRMRNFQIFLFCLVDAISILLNAGILLLLATGNSNNKKVKAKKNRLFTANKFFVSNVGFQLVTALTAIVFAARFQENKAAELRKDTVIVQITFTLLGLGMTHFMLTIDRIVTITMRARYSLVLSATQTKLMVAISWVIPTMVAIVSAAIVTIGKPSNQVSYGLAILTVLSGLTSCVVLVGLNVFLFKKMHAGNNNGDVRRSTRRTKLMTIVADPEMLREDSSVSESRICIAMAGLYVLLMFPQILFAFGKLSKTRGLLDMWYMQLASTLMLCSGVVDASLYVYMDKILRKDFRAKLRQLKNKLSTTNAGNDDKDGKDDDNDYDYGYESRTLTPRGVHKESRIIMDNGAGKDSMKGNETMLPQDILKNEIMLL
eukprot:gene3218-3695_t